MLNDIYPHLSPHKYTGLCIDILDALKEDLEFEYNIHPSKDGMYGAYDQLTGKWNGMIKELLDGVCIPLRQIVIS